MCVPPGGLDTMGYTEEQISAACLYGPTKVPPLLKKHRSPAAAQASTKIQNLPITTYYYDQVQWGMHLMQRNKLLRTDPEHVPSMFCYFVVWTPQYSQVCSVPYCPIYAQGMEDLARTFMRKKFTNLVRLKQKGELRPGEVEYTIHFD